MIILLIGLITAIFLVGIPLIVIGVVLIVRGLQSGQPKAVSAPQPPPHAPQQPPPPPPVVQLGTVQKETVIQREIIKVRCSYCGSLNDQAASYCVSCGGPMR